MRVLPRLRLLLARRPWLRWLVVGLCTAAVTAQLLAAQAALEHQRARWGTVRDVVVATARAAPGQPVTAAVQQWPEAVVPDGALTEPPRTGVAAREVAAGQMLTALDLVGDASVPAGWQVFAVPDDDLPGLAPTEPVSVYSGGIRLCDGTTAATDDGDRGVVEVAVPDDCAAAVSAALGEGALVVARRA